MKDVVVWMIKIEIQRQNGKITYFEIKGHADFSGYGDDIICAAVSSVGQMTINGLIETLKLQKKLEYIEKDGLITCDLKDSELTDDELEKADILIESMYSYLKAVARSYSEFVKLEEKIENK